MNPASIAPVSASTSSGFTTEPIKWIHLQSDSFEYPIDYWIAVLGVNPASGDVNFLVKWPAATYCHFHRHIADTTSLVLEGEHHVKDASDPEADYSIRQAGFFVQSPAGDTHLERSGPNGAVVLFSMKTTDGRLFEILNDAGHTINTVTLNDFQDGTLR